MATLRLSAEHGLEGVTAEMIAARAGISLRTFFNYFPNKEAAAAGEPPHFPAEDLEAFIRADGPLSEDLRDLIRRHLIRVSEDREMLVLFRLARAASPQLKLTFLAFMDGLRDEVGEALVRRAPEANPSMLRLLATMTHETGLLTIGRWIEQEGLALPPIFDETWDEARRAARILAA